MPLPDFDTLETATPDFDSLKPARPDFESLKPVPDFETLKPSTDLSIPVLSARPPESRLDTLLRIYRQAGEIMTPLVGPSEEERLRDAVGMDANGQPIYKPAGSDVEREGLFPALSHPFIPIPRAPQEDLSGAPAAARVPLQTAAAVWNTVAPFAEFMESPLGLATGGLAAGARVPALLKRLVSIGYGVDVARHLPEAAARAGEASVSGDAQQQLEAGLGLGVNIVLPAVLAYEAVKGQPRQIKEPAKPRPPGQPVVISEFGGLPEIPPPSGQAGVENVAPGANGEVVLEGSRAKTGGGDDLVAEGEKKIEQGGTENTEILAAAPAAPEQPIVAELAPAAAGERPSVIVRKALREGLDAREDLPASLVDEYNAKAEVPFAMPEAYELQGDKWVYQDPGEKLTPEQQAKREAAEAMGELRASKETETAEPTETAEKGLQTERTEAGTPIVEHERPPDILDWIEQVFPGGLRLESKADYGEYLKRARGRAAELMRMDRGTRADQVLQAMHAEGMWRRLDSPDDLFEAMVRAGEGRIDWRARQIKAKDKIEEMLNRAIEATRPGTGWTGEASMGVLKVPPWLAQEAAHAALKVARAAYVTVRDLGQALGAGLEHLRGLKLSGFNEGEAKIWLEGALGLRETAQKIAASEAVSEAVKNGITQYLYERRTNATDEELAKGIVAQASIEGAEQALRDPPASLHPATWSRLLGVVTRELADAERLARHAGDEATAKGLAERAARLWDEVLPRITEQAQSLQALNDIVALSPDAQVARLKHGLEREADKATAQHRPETDQIRTALDEGRQAGVEAVRQDPAVNGATRAAVDEQVANSPEVHRGIVMELAGPWAESPFILRHAREQVRAKADELLNRQPRPPGFNAAQRLRQILDDLAKRAADIAAGHYQGAEPGATLKEKLVKRLGLAEEQAGRLAKQLDAEWARQVEAARKKLPKRIAAQRVARERAQSAVSQSRSIWDREQEAASQALVQAMKQKTAGPKPALQDFAERLTQGLRRQIMAALPAKAAKVKLTDIEVIREGMQNSAKYAEVWERAKMEMRHAYRDDPVNLARLEQKFGELVPEAFPTLAADAAIRKQLRELNAKLGQVLRSEVDRQTGTGDHIAERIVQASGLTGEAADTLRGVLRQRWDALVTAAQVRALEQLQKRSGVTLTRPLKTAFQKLVELERMGALTSERFFDVVKESLKLKRLTSADAAELRRLVQTAQALPEGFLRQTAAAEVLKFLEKASGNVKWADYPLAIFFANVLSGMTTYAKIPFENANLLVGQTLASLLARPADTLLHPIDVSKALLGAYKRGLGKGALQAAGTMRTGVVSGVWAETRRPMLLEMKPFGEKMEWLNYWKWLTRAISTTHELTFKPAWELKQTMLARDIGRREGLRGPALEQRVTDLMANTEEQVVSARATALRELQEAGAVDKLNLARRTREILEQRREERMPGSTEIAREFALRTAYLNEPYGVMGLIANGIRNTLEALRKEAPVVGTAVKTQIPFTTVVANILNEKLNWTPVGLARALRSRQTGELYGRRVLDPKERAELYAKAIAGTIAFGVLAEYFGDHIHGNGPSDPRRRRQLQAAGWVPHSIEFGGRYFSYMNTPLALPLALVGNYKDWQRFGKGDDADGAGRVAYVAKGSLNAIISQGMLDSVKRLFESVGSESTAEGADKLEKLLARTGSSFIVPNLVQQMDRMFDPTVYDKTGIEALLRGQVPFVRRTNKPALSVLGDHIEANPFEYWTGTVTPDPLLRVLAEKKAWVSEPGRTQVVGDKKLGPDHYRAITNDELYQMVAESGPKIRDRLTKALDEVTLIGNTVYPNLREAEPWQAQAVVRHIADQEHAAAKAKLF